MLNDTYPWSIFMCTSNFLTIRCEFQTQLSPLHTNQPMLMVLEVPLNLHFYSHFLSSPESNCIIIEHWVWAKHACCWKQLIKVWSDLVFGVWSYMKMKRAWSDWIDHEWKWTWINWSWVVKNESEQCPILLDGAWWLVIWYLVNLSESFSKGTGA